MAGIMAVCAVLLRCWARAIAQIQQTVQEFSVRHARCFVESDRVLVQRNIWMLMMDFGFVRPGGEEEEALDQFDALVRQEVPEALRRAIGHAGLPYRYVVMTVIAWIATDCDIIGAAIASEGFSRAVCIGTICRFTWVSFVLPLCVAQMFWIANRYLHVRGMWDWGWHAVIALSCVVTVMCFLIVGQRLAYMASDSDMALAGLCAFSACLGLCTWAIYRVPRRHASVLSAHGQWAGLAMESRPCEPTVDMLGRATPSGAHEGHASDLATPPRACNPPINAAASVEAFEEIVVKVLFV